MQSRSRLFLSLGFVSTSPASIVSPAGVCFFGLAPDKGIGGGSNMGLGGLARGHRCQQPGRPSDALRIAE